MRNKRAAKKAAQEKWRVSITPLERGKLEFTEASAFRWHPPFDGRYAKYNITYRNRENPSLDSLRLLIHGNDDTYLVKYGTKEELDVLLELFKGNQPLDFNDLFDFGFIYD